MGKCKQHFLRPDARKGRTFLSRRAPPIAGNNAAPVVPALRLTTPRVSTRFREMRPACVRRRRKDLSSFRFPLRRIDSPRLGPRACKFLLPPPKTCGILPEIAGATALGPPETRPPTSGSIRPSFSYARWMRDASGISRASESTD